MCGGVGFKIKNIPKKELLKYYSKEQIRDAKKNGELEVFYWNDNAVLPVADSDGTGLVLWGNKDKNIKLPKTGWARIESLEQGKWDYLSPEQVDIDIMRGYEKKVWFSMADGAKGILVEKDGVKRIYMITKEASKEYEKKTGHLREPIGLKKSLLK